VTRRALHALPQSGVRSCDMEQTRRTQRGFSMVELLVAVAIILIILSVAIVNVIRARQNSAETIVIKEVQTIGTAQTQYLSQFGHYAATLAELGPAPDGSEGPQAAHLIPAKLASGEKDGYIFEMVATTGGYTVNALPKEFGRTGRRTFFLDQDGVVHQNWGRDRATAASPEI